MQTYAMQLKKLPSVFMFNNVSLYCGQLVQKLRLKSGQLRHLNTGSYDLIKNQGFVHFLYKFCTQPIHRYFLSSDPVINKLSPLSTCPTITIKEYIKE